MDGASLGVNESGSLTLARRLNALESEESLEKRMVHQTRLQSSLKLLSPHGNINEQSPMKLHKPLLVDYQIERLIQYH